MKKVKKMVSIVLAVLLIVTTVNTGNLKAEQLDITGTCGKVLYRYSNNGGAMYLMGDRINGMTQCTPTLKDGNYINHFWGQAINLRSIDITGVTDIPATTFADCEQNISIKMNDGYLKKLNERTFYRNKVLKYIIPSSYNGTVYEGTFVIPGNIKTIGKECFYQCWGLGNKLITMNGVERIEEGAFKECNTSSASWSNTLTYIGKEAFKDNINFKICYWTAALKDPKAESYKLPDSLTYIGDEAFSGCYSTSEIYIPKNVSYIGKDAFYGLRYLRHIEVAPENKRYESVDGVMYDKTTKTVIKSITWSDIIEIDSLGVKKGTTEIEDNAFRDSRVHHIDLPASLERIGNDAFNNTKLVEVVIPENVSVVSSGSFKDCTGLTSVVASGAETIGDSAFSNDAKLEKIILSDNLKTIGDSTFSNCQKLNNVEIPEDVNSIGSKAFENCSSLESINIPASVKTIKAQTFKSCSSLKNVVLSEGLEKIEAEAFRNCGSIETISIPKTVKSIDPTAFQTTGIKTIYYEGTLEELKNLMGDSPLLKNGNITLVTSHSHNYIEDSNTSTCTKEGVQKLTCSICKNKCVKNVPAKGHKYSEKITKIATKTSTGEKTYTCTVCGFTKKEIIPKIPDDSSNSYSSSTNKVVSQKNETTAKKPVEVKDVHDLITKKTNTDKKDVLGSSFRVLKLKGVDKVKKVELSWSKVKGANKYIIYGAKCGSKMKKIKTLKNTTYTNKKLKVGTWYKYMVIAVNKDGKVISVSKTIHVPTRGSKYGTPERIKLNVSKKTLKKGKSFTIKGSVEAKKKISNHTPKFRYESSNTKVATVTTKGKVKAKKKGKCYVYVYTENGLYKRVKVKVK